MAREVGVTIKADDQASVKLKRVNEEIKAAAELAKKVEAYERIVEAAETARFDKRMKQLLAETDAKKKAYEASLAQSQQSVGAGVSSPVAAGGDSGGSGLAGTLGVAGKVAGAAAVAIAAVGAAAMAAGARLASATSSAAAYAVAVKAAADRSGASTELISGLAHTASQSNVSFDQLSQAMITLAQNASTQPQLFKDWGISVADANGNMKPTGQLLNEVADKLHSTGSASQRAAIAMQTMGEGGRLLVPVLAAGSAEIAKLVERNKALGVTVDATTAALATKFTGAVSGANATISAVVRTLAGAFMPALTRVAEVAQQVFGRFLEYVRDNDRAIRVFATQTIALLLEAFSLASNAMAGLSYVAEGAVSIFTTRFAGAFSGGRKLLGDMADAASSLATELEGNARKTNSSVIPAVDAETGARMRLTDQMRSEAQERARLLGAVGEKEGELAEAAVALEDALRGKRKQTLQEAVAAAEKQLESVAKVTNVYQETEVAIDRATDALAEARAISKEVSEGEISALDQLVYGSKAKIQEIADARVRAAQRQLYLAEQSKLAQVAGLEAEKAAVEEKQAKVEQLTKEHQDRIEALALEQVALQVQERRRAIDLQIADAERAAAAQQAIEDQVYGAASQSLFRLGLAWVQFLRTRDENTVEANQQIVERLVDAGNQVAEGIGAAAAGLVMQFKSAMATIGNVETETRQRIAIVQERIEKQAGDKTKDRKDKVLRYVESISEAEIKALERVGQKAQVVTETIAIKTRTAGDAIKSFFKGIIDVAIQEATRLLVSKGIELLFKLLGIVGGAATGGVGSVVVAAAGAAAGGAVSGAVGGGGGGTFVSRSTSGLSVGTSSSALRSSGGGSPAGGRPEVRQTIVALTSSRAQLRRLHRDVLEPEAEQLRRLRVKTR